MPPRLSIRWWFLCKFAVVSLVVLIGIHFGHRAQVRRQAGALLRQADAARDATPANEEREIDYLRRYLVSQPNAIDERERVARLLARKARNRKELAEALLVIEDVLSRDPNRDALRKYAVEVALDPRLLQTAEAKGHLTELMKKRPNDGELEDLFAYCLGREDKFQESADLYRQACQHKPDQLNAYDGRAFLLREKLTKPDEADQVIRDMVRINPDNFRSHELEARYWERAGKLDAAEAAIARAKAKAPDELSVILYSAELSLLTSQKLRQKGLPEEIKAVEARLRPILAELDRGMTVHAESPDRHLLYLVKARVEAAIHTPADAVAVINAGLKSMPEKVELLEALADYQVRAKDPQGANATLALLEKLGTSPDKLAFSQAGILVLREQWVQAAKAYDRIRRESISNPPQARLANLRLGDCYEEIGETDRRLDAYTRALPDDSTDPVWIPAMLGQARAYTAMGRLEDALSAYQKVVDTQAVDKVASGVLVQVGRLRILKALRSTDPANIDWRPVEEAVTRAVKNFPEDTDALLLQSDLHLFRDQKEESRKIINDLFAKKPKDQTVWIAKASLAFRDQSPAAAVAFIEKGRAELGDSVELRLAQARFSADPKDPSAIGQKLSALGKDVEKFSVNQQRRLYRGLAEMAGQAGDAKIADTYWDRVVEVQKYDLPAHLIRFDRFLRANDDADLQLALKKIRDIDGENGASTRASQASYLIWNAQRKAQQQLDNKDDLDKAFLLMEGLQRDRPNWSRIPLAKALIWDLRNNPSEALPNYRQAVERGVYEPQVLRRLVELLAAKGLNAEANDVLAKLPDLASSGPDMQRLAAEVSLESANTKRALELAAKAVPPDSKKASDWIWLGRLRWQAGDRVGAGKALEQAVTLDPKAPEGWLLLVNFLVSNQKPGARDLTAARARIEKAGQAVPPEAKSLLLAQCYAMVGEKKLAIDAYKSARTEKPNDLRVLFAEADFLTSSQEWELAREAWERLIPLANANAEEKDFARRMYAICFAADPDYTRARQAVALLGMDQGGTLKNPIENESSAQRRTRALALAMQRDRASKLNAISLLEQEGAKLTPADKFMLAKIYNQVGARKNVRTTMIELLNSPETNPLYNAFLSYFTEWLLEQRDYPDAASWLAKMEKALPDAPRTYQLKIRLLAGKKDLSGARAALAKLAEKPEVPPGALALIAEQSGLLAEADEFLKKFVAQNQEKRPEAILARAEFYGRTGRLKEAMDICDQAWETCPPLTVAQVSIGALTAGKTNETRELLGRVTQKFQAASQKQGLPPAAIDSQMAFLKNLAGDYDGAIAIFRSQITSSQQLKTLPEKETVALAMNNLAFLLAFHKRDHAEALSLIRQARALIGDFPDLLDTEALVLIDRGAKQDFETARPILEGLVASNPTGTAFYHLALLEKKLKRREEMIFAYREADRLQLKSTDLHPIERVEFEAMEREFK